jgi:hypothetical protein
MQAADQRMREMHERMESQEQRQNTIVNFLARVAQNPTVLQQMVSVAQSAGLQRLSSQRGGEADAEQQVALQQQYRLLYGKSCAFWRCMACAGSARQQGSCGVTCETTPLVVMSAKPSLTVMGSTNTCQLNVVLQC